MRTASGLYAVQGAVLVVPLITLPYLTRVLSPANLGLLLFSQAFAAILTGVIDFGYEISASRDAARHQGDRPRLRELVSSVLAAKILLILGSSALAAVVWVAIPLFRENPDYLLLAWALGMLQGLTPLWFFLGIERIGVPAALELGAKLATAGGIFAWVHAADDGFKVLILQVATTGTAVAVGFAVVQRSTGFTLRGPATAFRTLKTGLNLALYHGGVIAHQSVPPLLVGVLAAPAQVGYFGVADKAARVPMAFLWPLSRALYPRVNSLLSRDPSRAGVVVRRSLVFFLLSSTAAAVGLVIVAPWLIPFALGEQYDAAVPAFRILAVAIPFGLASHVLTYQVLAPLRRDRAIARAAWLSVALMVLLAAILTPMYGASGMAVAVLVDSTAYALLLVGFIVHQRIRLRSIALLSAREEQPF